MEKLILMGLFSLIYLRGVMIYLHSGLKGELIRALGIFIIMLAYSIDNIVWGAIGFITFNVGWLVLRLKENEYWKEIFGSLTYYERIIGIIPQFLDEAEFRSAFFKVIVVTFGIFLITILFEIVKAHIS